MMIIEPNSNKNLPIEVLKKIFQNLTKDWWEQNDLNTCLSVNASFGMLAVPEVHGLSTKVNGKIIKRYSILCTKSKDS